MSVILMGFDVNKGSMPSPTTGELIEWNKRVISFKTNDGENNATSFGFKGFEETIKSSDLALSLGVSDGDNVINNCLVNLIDKEVEILRVPKKGVMTAIGIRPVKK